MNRVGMAVASMTVVVAAFAVSHDDGDVAAKERRPFGLAILPRTSGFADESERQLFLKMGDIDAIDQIHAAASPEEFFGILDRIARSGRVIDYLVIGGHGPKPGNDDPGILLGDLRLGPQHIDTTELWGELTMARFDLEALEERERASRANPSAELTARVGRLRRSVASMREYHDLVAAAPRALGRGATLHLFNCNAIQGPNGRRFTNDLGRLLLGSDGGTVWASRTNVGLGNFVTRFVADARGEQIPVTAEWERIDIDPVYFFPVEPRHPWSAKTSEQLEAIARPIYWIVGPHGTSAVYAPLTEGAPFIARTATRLEYFDQALFLDMHELEDFGDSPEHPGVAAWEVWKPKEGDGPNWRRSLTKPR